MKILDLRSSHDLIRTRDFSGSPGLEKIILENCIHLVQIHESIGDLHCLVILNMNCKSLVGLPEEMSRLNSLEELVLCGCSKLESLNMDFEHHQGRRLHRSDRIVASTSYITSLPLKLFFPSRFSEMKNSRFTSFTLQAILCFLLHYYSSTISWFCSRISSMFVCTLINLILKQQPAYICCRTIFVCQLYPMLLQLLMFLFHKFFKWLYMQIIKVT